MAAQPGGHLRRQLAVSQLGPLAVEVAAQGHPLGQPAQALGQGGWQGQLGGRVHGRTAVTGGSPRG